MFYLRTIEPRTLELLKSVLQEPLLANNFLVGGTSLALQMGHRFSVDLDLFTHQPFEAEPLLEALRANFKVQPLTITNTIFIVVVEDIKVIRSLTYFEDAEETEDPIVFDKKVTWPVVKKRMVQVVRDNF
ncbi:MAG: nucleotidyl transferase AbiEii/AbiGii toxin family protein [Phycisphaerae bacterium]|nr:nucleotidyl transferase AbiEii/AbiGii toxin family protein [Saprospiraceae bacterium]